MVGGSETLILIYVPSTTHSRRLEFVLAQISPILLHLSWKFLFCFFFFKNKLWAWGNKIKMRNCSYSKLHKIKSAHLVMLRRHQSFNFCRSSKHQWYSRGSQRLLHIRMLRIEFSPAHKFGNSVRPTRRRQPSIVVRMSPIPCRRKKCSRSSWEFACALPFYVVAHSKLFKMVVVNNFLVCY